MQELPYNNEEQRELLKRSRKGDKLARDELILYAYKLVIKINKRSVYKNNNEDIIHENLLNAIKIIDKGYKLDCEIPLFGYISYACRKRIPDIVARLRLISYKSAQTYRNNITEIKRYNSYSHETISKINDSIEINLDILTNKEREIIVLLYGLEGNQEHNYRQLNARLNLSKSRICVLRRSAMTKIYHQEYPDQQFNLKRKIKTCVPTTNNIE